MVIVECVALSIMVSNDIVVPLVLQRGRPIASPVKRTFGDFLLRVRRIAIFAIMAMAYLYYRALGNTQLAAIGLLSFAAIAQLAPGIFRRIVMAARHGAAAPSTGMLVGFRGLDLHAVSAEFSGKQYRRPDRCCSTAHSASRHYARRRCSVPICRRCCMACSGALSLNILLTYVALSLARQPILDRAIAGGSVRAATRWRR